MKVSQKVDATKGSAALLLYLWSGFFTDDSSVNTSKGLRL
jgi:hypothetical protein